MTKSSAVSTLPLDTFQMPTELTAEESEKIRRNFKRCGDETVEAILEFRRGRDVARIPFIARGIIGRYLRDEAKGAIASASLDTPLTSLGVDSLTMLEIILDLQEALDVSIEDSELRDLQTIGDVFDLLTRKATESGSQP